MDLNVRTDGGSLVMDLPRMVNSGNAEEMKREILAAMAAHPGCPVVLDAEQTDHISSAGLRMLLFISRQTADGLLLRGVSPEVYDILQITGFTDIMTIE